MHRPRSFLVLALILAGVAPRNEPLRAAGSRVLWQIGKSDRSSAEFALAPDGFRRFTADAVFVVGRSDAATAWPYVQPGPEDGWAGGRPHTSVVAFGLKRAPEALPANAPDASACRLVVELAASHRSAPPVVTTAVNGRAFERRLPPGGSDEAVRGTAAQGDGFSWTDAFPCSVLKAGNNEVRIATTDGSWLIYDSVRLEAPADLEISPVADETRIERIEAAPVWLTGSGGAVQPLSAVVWRLGPPIEGTVRGAGGAPAPALVTEGFQAIHLSVPASELEREVAVTLDLPGQATLVANARVSMPGVREIWLLPHSHVDIGYTHRQADVVALQVGNLEKAMELARDSAADAAAGAQFKWNPEAAWTLEHFLAKASPDKREALARAVLGGEVGIDALFANMLTGLCRPEELVQAVAPAVRIGARMGAAPVSASTCDVPGWTWGMVPALAQAGVKYFAIGPNFGDRVGTIHQWDDRPFYWKSASGQERILCWVVDNYHHHGPLDPEVTGQLRRLERMRYPYDTAFMFWVGVWPNGDVDNAPPDEQLSAKVREWNAGHQLPKLRIGLASEFFSGFERKHGSALEEFAGDITPYWEDGAGSTARETALNRASADRLSQAAAIFAARRPADYPADQFQAAWRSVLLYSEHTWGADISIRKPDDPMTVDQWKAKQAFALDADRQSRALLAAAVPPLEGAISSIDVYNTTQWERTDVVKAPARAGAAGVVDDRGHAVSAQRLATGELLFVARDVPAFGARRYRILWRPPLSVEGKATVGQGGAVLETETVRVEIDTKTGAIKSLKRAGVDRDFVDGQATVGLNDFRYVLGEDTAGARPNGPITLSIVDEGPVTAAVRIESEAPGCNRLVREVRVVDGVDRVELTDTVDRKAVREKDAVHFGFAFNVPGGTVRMETPWAVVRPNDDQLPGSNRNWFTVQRWVDVSNADSGITLAPLDAPLVEIGSMTAALLGSVATNRWLTRAPESQTIYSWAQNNHWHTNYKADQPGETVFRYILRPHAGGYSAAESSRLGMETSRPLLAAPSDAKRGLPKPLLTVSSANVLVETVKASDDGKGVVVRLFGVGGQREAVVLKWLGWKPRTIWRTDLTEKPLQRIEGAVDVPAYGVVHIRADR
jgi:alpha-mannosidase